MPSYSNTAILSALAAAASVSAHGFVESINIGGTSYAGYNVFSAPYQANPPTVVGWANTATDSGFVSPDKYNTPDIICHLDATNAKGHARVAAGDSVWLQWNTWPESHKGPVLDYLAACGADGCENVDKTDLKFFKIDEAGLLDGSAAPGHYAADELLENGIGWLVQIPESIKPGFYVLRHEIIALHSSQDQNGAQNYPQCINLEITGSGTEEPEGTPGMELYKPDDAGIFLNIYQSLNSYKIPGPAVVDGAKTVDQVKPEVTATGTATTGTELAAAPTNAPTSTSAASAPEVTSAAPEGEESGSATGVLPTAPTGPAQTVEITPGQPQPTSVEEPQAPQPTTCVKKAKSGKKGKRSLKNKKAKKARRGAVPRL
ncbi:glycosyl hydrolase family 61 domain-containing protein [Sarocladium implicatum]|nr:glycosyl hydrolase family 61 domain-containing protein [Sarocladium implicatum]